MSEEDLEIELNDEEDSPAKDTKAKSKKGATAKTSGRKIRLTLTEDDNSQLVKLQDDLKDRGLKNYDLSAVVSEALATIPETWWKEKLDELTPLEWKIQAALDNPEMREKLVSLLDG